MPSIQTIDPGPAIQMPVILVAELQDSLLTAMHDLSRLEGLLSHATENLMDRFSVANSSLAGHAVPDPGAIAVIRKNLHSAVTELQFHDMATQLIGHTTKVLRGCAHRLAVETMGQEDDEEELPVVELMPDRPNPVTQSEMDAGSVDLF
jgi:hypothetical protein